MGLHVNLMMDAELRKNILELVREQVRPVVREELSKMITEELARNELQKLMAELPQKVADKLRYAIANDLRYDRDFHGKIAEISTETLKTKLAKMSSSDIEAVVQGVLRKKFGGI